MQQAVKLSGVSRATLYRLLADAKVTRYRVPGHRSIYVNRRELLEALLPRRLP
jgi:predicted DNA-binding transcriptional regulator AlpA